MQKMLNLRKNELQAISLIIHFDICVVSLKDNIDINQRLMSAHNYFRWTYGYTVSFKLLV